MPEYGASTKKQKKFDVCPLAFIIYISIFGFSKDPDVIYIISLENCLRQ